MVFHNDMESSRGFAAVEETEVHNKWMDDLAKTKVPVRRDSEVSSQIWFESDHGSVANFFHNFGQGAINEVKEHPWRVVGSAALGLGLGVVGTLAPEVVGGITLAMSFAVPMFGQTGVLSDMGLDNVGCRKDSYSCSSAERWGGAAVDVVAGLLGGLGGVRLGDTAMFAPIRESFNLEPNHFGSASAVRDSAGRPLKLPLENNTGSAYMTYDANGELSKIRSFYNDGVTRLYVKPGSSQPWIFSEKLLHGLEIPPSPISGATIAMDANAGTVTIQGSLGTHIMRSTGNSEFVRTAAQAAKAAPLEKAIRSAYKAAIAAEEGGMAVPMAPMVRPF